MKIVTLTLSPAFDVHCSVPNFTAERENLVESSARENGVTNCALVVLGEENGADFLRGMDSVGITDRITLSVNGRIRENITVHPDSGNETRISFKGFTADALLLDKVFELINADGDTLVTFTGSLPGGVSASETEAFLAKLKNSGSHLVIDSKSVPLDMLMRLKPWLIKPNAEELAAYFGELSESEIINTAVRLHSEGIENALISLGADGAVLACDEGLFVARPPHVDAVSTIGAGDSMIAGFIAAESEPAENRLKTAIAYGSAACLREGTNPPKSQDIADIRRLVVLEKIN